jgi:hypothetical protein
MWKKRMAYLVRKLSEYGSPIGKEDGVRKERVWKGRCKGMSDRDGDRTMVQAPSSKVF